MTASNLTADTAILPSTQSSTHLGKGHQKKEGNAHAHTHTHTHIHTHTHTHTHKTAQLHAVFSYFILQKISHCLVADVNHYYLNPLDKGLSTITDAYKAEMFVLEAIIVQMGQCL